MNTPILVIRRGDAPLILSMPHVGTAIPADIAAHLVSPWRATKDTDWSIAELYGFAADLDATIVQAHWSRTVVDLNRDPSGASLYPGQTITGLCPLETFDGEPLYRHGDEPVLAEIERRKDRYFSPYHAALSGEISRLKAGHDRIVVYDCHSIRSRIPRLFDGTLPLFNLGSNAGTAADPALVAAVAVRLAASGRSHVVDGRFKGGWITRHYGQPEMGVHALQMEISCRGYLDEPVGPVDETTWPVAFDRAYAAPIQATLTDVLAACLAFARP